MRHPNQRRYRNWLRVFVGVVVSAVLVWWCLRGIDTSGLLSALRTVPVGAILCGLVILWMSLPLRAYQWRLILQEKALSTRLLLRITCLGAAANVAMPLRGGEVVKVVLLRRWGHVPLRKAAVSLILCRLQDLPPIGFAFGVALLQYRGLGMSIVWPMQSPNATTLVAGLAVLALVIIGCVVAFRNRRRDRFPWIIWQRVYREGREIAQGLPSSSSIVSGQVIAFLCWALFAISAVPVVWALIDCSWGEALWISLVVCIWSTAAALLPAAPGGFGTVHAACMGGLLSIRPETDRELALALAIVLHAMGTLGPALPASVFLMWRRPSSPSLQ
jgi:hypothetical protein